MKYVCPIRNNAKKGSIRINTTNTIRLSPSAIIKQPIQKNGAKTIPNVNVNSLLFTLGCLKIL